MKYITNLYYVTYKNYYRKKDPSYNKVPLLIYEQLIHEIRHSAQRHIKYVIPFLVTNFIKKKCQCTFGSLKTVRHFRTGLKPLELVNTRARCQSLTSGRQMFVHYTIQRRTKPDILTGRQPESGDVAIFHQTHDARIFLTARLTVKYYNGLGIKLPLFKRSVI